MIYSWLVFRETSLCFGRLILVPEKLICFRKAGLCFGKLVSAEYWCILFFIFYPFGHRTF